MEIGDRIGGKYKILSLIGKGGFSSVYLASDIENGKLFAVKEYKKAENEINTDYEIILREAQILSNLSYSGIPQVLEISDTGSRLVIIMDYIKGETLDRIIQDTKPFSEETSINFARQLINIFMYLHLNNIIYRDLKPSNIMLSETGQIWLVDFGTVRKYSPEKLGDTTCLGTMGYAAPEQYGGRGQSDFRTDIYGFGVTLFYLLTGKGPVNNFWDTYSIRKINREFSYALDYIIVKCTQVNPDNRYQTFDEVKYDFEHKEKLGRRLRKKLFFKNLFGKDNKLFEVKKKAEDEKIIPAPYNTVAYNLLSTMDISDETVVLAGDNMNKPLPPSVSDMQKVHIFLSYCNKDNDLADIICENLAQYNYISISRYTTDVPYKNSFREFMNSLNMHDKVIMIITDQYMKSKACMYEVGQLINSPSFQKKILFVICTNKDKKYYKSEPKENIEANIYDPHGRNQYIIYWENECEKLEKDLKQIKSENAKLPTREEIKDITKIVDYDIGPFMKYLADVNGISFDNLYLHNFMEFLKEIET